MAVHVQLEPAIRIHVTLRGRYELDHKQLPILVLPPRARRSRLD
ncbi:hypothetical protein [Streptomyces sp. NPDC059142]